MTSGRLRSSLRILLVSPASRPAIARNNVLSLVLLLEPQVAQRRGPERRIINRGMPPATLRCVVHGAMRMQKCLEKNQILFA